MILLFGYLLGTWPNSRPSSIEYWCPFLGCWHPWFLRSKINIIARFSVIYIRYWWSIMSTILKFRRKLFEKVRILISEGMFKFLPLHKILNKFIIDLLFLKIHINFYFRITARSKLIILSIILLTRLIIFIHRFVNRINCMFSFLLSFSIFCLRLIIGLVIVVIMLELIFNNQSSRFGLLYNGHSVILISSFLPIRSS